MGEISKPFKIFLIIAGIIALIFAIIYLIIPELYLSSIDWPYYDPFYSRYAGIVSLVISIFIFVAIKRGEWEKIQLYMEMCITYLLFVIFLTIWALIVVSQSPTSVINSIFTMVIFIILDVVAIYFYVKERK
jgi:hypothetical protein